MNPEEISDSELIELANVCNSKKEFCESLGFKSTTVWRKGPLSDRISKLDIKIIRTPKRKYSDEQILEASKNARSVTEIMRKIGMCPTGYAHNRFKHRLRNLGVDVDSMPGAAWNAGLKSSPKRSTKEYLKLDGPFISTSKLRQKLINDGILKNRCDECDLGPEWNNKPLSMQLEHINGNRRDNRLNNLRILCPNCHTQTPTHSKIKNGRVLE